MTALAIFPVLVLPLMFALHTLERWALRAPAGSRFHSGPDQWDGAPDAIPPRRPAGAK